MKSKKCETRRWPTKSELSELLWKIIIIFKGYDEVLYHVKKAFINVLNGPINQAKIVLIAEKFG